MESRAAPVRTCVGCRGRAHASELLRVVAVEHGAERLSRNTSGEAVFSVVPDPARRRPGRGAHIHPDPNCLALAERRRAFGRALRVVGVLDTGPLVEYVGSGLVGPTRSGASRDSERPPVGQPTRTRKVGRPI